MLKLKNNLKSLNSKWFFKGGNIIKAIISLVIIIALALTASFSWFSMKTTLLYSGSENFSLKCGKQLRVNDSGESNISFAEGDKYLIPCSSVDGRNLYFPTDGLDFSDVTTDMTFRTANAGDKNVNYIQIDFTLTAQQDHTALYINDEFTSIQIADKKSGTNPVYNSNDYSIQRAAPLRAALWCENNSENVPVVFNPLAKKVVTPAVNDADLATGSNVHTASQVAQPFSYYSYEGGHEVAILDAGEETHFSYIIWLEGTDPKCTFDRIANKKILVNLAFTTSWDNVEKIRLVDNSTDNWIKGKIYAADEDDRYVLYLRHTYGSGSNATWNDYAMSDYYKPSGNNVQTNEWYCELPGDISEHISFILRPLKSSSTNPIYVFDRDEYGNPTKNRHHNRQYEVNTAAAATPDECKGHWVPLGDSEGGGYYSGDIDGDDF